MKNIIKVSGLILLLVSCAAPELSNLHREAYSIGELNKPEELITINVNLIPLSKPKSPDKEKPKYFFDLNDSTQNKYLDVIENMVDDNTDSLISVLKKPLFEPKSKKSKLQKDFTEIKARFYLGNIKHYYKSSILKANPNFIHPNTRLSWLNIRVMLDDESILEISTIDQLQSVYESVDFGTIERNQNVTFNSKLTGQYGVTNENSSARRTSRGINSNSTSTTLTNIYDEDGNLIDSITLNSGESNLSNRSFDNSSKQGVSAGIGGEVGYANTEAIKEAFNFAYNDFKTGFSFDKKSITVSQKGRMFADISDNVIVTTTLRPKKARHQLVHNFSDLFQKNGAINSASKINITNRTIKYLPCSSVQGKTFTNKINYEYDGLLRTVLNNSKTVNRLEYDDMVRYYPFKHVKNTSDEENIEIDLGDYCKKVYRVHATFKNDGGDYLLSIANPTALDAYVMEDENPLLLYKWIKEIAKDASDKNLTTNSFSLFFEGPNDKRIYLANSKLDDDTIEKLKTLEDLNFEEVCY